PYALSVILFKFLCRIRKHACGRPSTVSQLHNQVAIPCNPTVITIGANRSNLPLGFSYIPHANRTSSRV
ncbi:major facilitator superfamily protein, partial [Moniliophthora roreri]